MVAIVGIAAIERRRIADCLRKKTRRKDTHTHRHSFECVLRYGMVNLNCLMIQKTRILSVCHTPGPLAAQPLSANHCRQTQTRKCDRQTRTHAVRWRSKDRHQRVAGVDYDGADSAAIAAIDWWRGDASRVERAARVRRASEHWRAQKTTTWVGCPRLDALWIVRRTRTRRTRMKMTKRTGETRRQRSSQPGSWQPMCNRKWVEWSCASRARTNKTNRITICNK